MFVTLAVLVLAGLVGPLVTYLSRERVPVVVGQLAAGLLLGRTGFGVVNPTDQPLPAFAAIGFAMLMLTSGTNVDIESPTIRKGFAQGLLAFLTTAAVAFPAGLLIDHLVGVGRPALLVVLIAGSSAAIAFPIITEHNLEGPHIAVLMSWIAVADAVTVVAMPLTLAGSTNLAAALLGDVAIIAAAAALIWSAGRFVGTRVERDVRYQSVRHGWTLQLRASLLALLGLSAIAQLTGASTLIAGFLAGIIIVRFGESNRLSLQLSALATGFFVPLFLVLLGSQLDLRALLSAPSRIVLAIALALAAVIAHVIAARVSARDRVLATGLASSAQLGMPAAAASLGLATHLLSPADAAAIVAAGCLTLIPASFGGLMLARGSVARQTGRT